MRREFNQNIIILLLINVLVKPVYLFGVETRVQNLVGIDNYGIYFALLDFVFLFLFISDPGIQSYNAKYVAQNRAELSAYLPQVVGSKILLGIGFGLATVSMGLLIGYPPSLLLLGLILFYWTSSMFVLLRGTMAGIGAYKTDSILSAIDKLLMLLIIGYLVWMSSSQDTFTMEKYVWIQVACSITAVVVFAALLLQKGYSLLPKFSLSFTKKLISQSLPFALIILLTSIFTRIDGVMIERILKDGSEQAGAYAASYRFIDAGNMLGFLFGGLLLSMYSSLIKEGESIQELFDTSYSQLLIIGTTIAGCCIFYSSDLFDLLYTEEYQGYHQILQMLMISFIPVTLTHSLGSLLQAHGSLRALNVLLASAVIFNVVANYLAIPIYGALGAAATSALTQFFILLGLVYIALRKQIIAPSFSQFIRTPLFLVLSITIIWWISEMNMNWMIGVVLAGVSSLVLSLLIFGKKIIT